MTNPFTCSTSAAKYSKGRGSWRYFIITFSDSILRLFLYRIVSLHQWRKDGSAGLHLYLSRCMRKFVSETHIWLTSEAYLPSCNGLVGPSGYSPPSQCVFLRKNTRLLIFRCLTINCSWRERASLRSREWSSEGMLTHKKSILSNACCISNVSSHCILEYSIFLMSLQLHLCIGLHHPNKVAAKEAINEREDSQ